MKRDSFPFSLAMLAAAALVACGGAVRPTCPREGGAAWHELRSSHFTYVTDEGVETAQVALARLEQVHAALVRLVFPRGVATQTRVVSLRSTSELRAFVPEPFAGEARAHPPDDPFGPPTILVASGLDEPAMQILTHELTHVLLRGAVGDAPPWLHEGMASYFETLRVEDDRLVVGEWRGAPVDAAKLPAASALFAMAPGEFYAREATAGSRAIRVDVGLRYAGAWQLVHRLHDDDAQRVAFYGLLQNVEASLRVLSRQGASPFSDRASGRSASTCDCHVNVSRAAPGRLGLRAEGMAMGLFDKEARKLWLGVGVGAGLVTVLPYVAPVMAAIARPLAKAVLGQGLLALERARERSEHVAEGLSDILAEVRAEAEAALAEQRAAARAEAGDVITGAAAGGETEPGGGVH